MAVERILGTETGKSAFEKTDRNVVALDASLVAHKADSATQTELGHIKLPEGWKEFSYTNGWGSLLEAGYRKNSFGDVEFKGVLGNSVPTSEAGTTIFILPSEYRPSVVRIITPSTFSSSTAGAKSVYLRVNSDGIVALSGGVGSNGYISLDGIKFTL